MSYETSLEIGGWCRDCTHAARRLTRFSGPGHYCSANHPKWSGWQESHLRSPRSEGGRLLLTLHPENGCQTWTRTKTSDLTGRRATLTPPGNGAAGRIFTCIIPLRRRMPHVFDHGSNVKWSARQDLHLQSLGPKPSVLAATLRADGGPEGTRTLSLPADNGLLWLFELRIRNWWEALVMLQSSLPTFVFDTGFTDRQPGHLPKLAAGVGITPT